MYFKDEDENEPRARSFRYEDYNNRRVFLRSYPLHWDGDDDDDDEEQVDEKQAVKMPKGSQEKKRRRQAKKIILSILDWGQGKVLVLRKVKNKVGFYLIGCQPLGFKTPTALIGV